MPSVPSVGGKHIRVIRDIRVQKNQCSLRHLLELKNIRVIRAIRVRKKTVCLVG